MDPEFQFIIAVVGIAAGTGLTIFVIHTLVGFVKFLISNRKGGSVPAGAVTKAEFDELKARLERRMQTLEAIVIDEEPAKLKSAYDEELPEAMGTGLRNKLKNR
jgi:hypothetical protein